MASARWGALWVASAAQLMVVLDVSVINVALPAVSDELTMTDSALQWVASGYTLAFAAGLLVGGRLADVYGLRRVFVVGLAVFVAASVVGGLAVSAEMLIAARAVQGVGAAIVSPATFTMLTRAYPEGPVRTRAVAVWTGVSLAGGGVGNIVSGVFTEVLTWRAVLLINVPIGLMVFVCALRVLGGREDRDTDVRIDITGAVLATVGLCAITYGVSEIGAGAGWTAGGATGLGAAALAILVARQRRSSSPIVPVTLLRNRMVAAGNVLTLLTGASFQVPIWIFLTYLMQRSMGYSPVQAGLGFIPLTLATVVVGVAVTPRLLTRMQPRHIIVAGAVFAASGFVWQAWVSHDSYLTAIAGPTIVIGIGGGLMNTPLATAVTSGIDAADAGAASGLMNTSKQFGGALGLAALGLITNSYTDYRPAFVAMAACMGLVAAGAAVALTPARPRVDANATTVDR